MVSRIWVNLLISVFYNMRLLSGLTRLYKVAFPDKKAKLYVFLFIALLSLFVLWVISIPLSYLFSSIFSVLVFSAVLFSKEARFG